MLAFKVLSATVPSGTKCLATGDCNDVIGARVAKIRQTRGPQ
jgi:hypothetical protein